MDEKTMYIIGIFLFLLIIVMIRIYSNRSNKTVCADVPSKKKKDKHKKKQNKDSYQEPSRETNIQEKITSSLDPTDLNKWNLANAINMFNDKQNTYLKKMNIIP